MNYISKLCLLEAELALMSRDAMSLKLFDKAITSFQKYGFAHEEVLAREKTRVYLLDLNQNDT